MTEDGFELFRRLISIAESNAGGVRAFAREVGWCVGSMGRVKAGKERISPFRAAITARYVGLDEKLTVARALRDGAKSTGETEYWNRLFAAELVAFDKAFRAVEIEHGREVLASLRQQVADANSHLRSIESEQDTNAQ